METMYLKKGQIMALSGILSSQMYVWQRDLRERKQRMPQIYAEEVNGALTNILAYPHMGGKKGAIMMIYDQVEYIGQRGYDLIKKQLKQIVSAEIQHRNLAVAGQKSSWQKHQAQYYGEIWCADFTPLSVLGKMIYIAIVVDAYSHYYPGYAVSDIADTMLVDQAFKMALKNCGGVLPQRYIINDRGSQYKSALYTEHLKEYNLKQLFIPPRTPWNNGEAEVGMQDIKALFYRQLSQNPKGEHQTIVDYSSKIADDIFKELNEKIPRLKLDGVTPSDIVSKKAEQKRATNQTFIHDRKSKRSIKTPIENLKQHISYHISLKYWSDRRLRNVSNLLNQQYNKVIPENV